MMQPIHELQINRWAADWEVKCKKEILNTRKREYRNLNLITGAMIAGATVIAVAFFVFKLWPVAIFTIALSTPFIYRYRKDNSSQARAMIDRASEALYKAQREHSLIENDYIARIIDGDH